MNREQEEFTYLLQGVNIDREQFLKELASNKFTCKANGRELKLICK